MIDGNAIAQKIISELKAKTPPAKILAAIVVGEDAGSLSFLRQKAKTARELGVKFKLYKLPETLGQKELEDEVRRISRRNTVGGVIVQLPLPKKYDRVPVLNAIGIEKDIDVLNGETSKVLAPATGALKRILESINFSPKGKRVAIVGAGLLIGRPITDWLMDQATKLTVMGKGGLDNTVLKEADLVISGTGVPNLITAEMIKSNAVVVDYGYGKLDGKMTGDVDYERISKLTPHVTPTPGGTGPIVVAQLFWNFFELNP